ncbi:hypothetical protein COCON_G00158970 [Conger conger]|uniref:Uncharacterized protein n=1 Tax=Conger conger TaxID=82655 RepID=A0A9Q1HV47_CONCO|nr:hypothetical protein COCON_G00158970 [Conger conger]
MEANCSNKYIHNQLVTSFKFKDRCFAENMWVCQLTWLIFFFFCIVLKSVSRKRTLCVFRVCVAEGSGERRWKEHSPVVKWRREGRVLDDWEDRRRNASSYGRCSVKVRTLLQG